MIVPDLSLTIAIPSKNRPADLVRCIASIRAQPTQPAEILVIDQSKEPYRFADHSLLRHVYAPGLRGLAQARNVAARECVTPLILFLDDDVELMTDCVSEVMATFARHADSIGVTCVVLRPPHGALAALKTEARAATYAIFDWGFFNSRPIRRRSGVQVRVVSGCCMAFRTALFGREQFDEHLQGYSLGEDWEFSVSARKHGTLWLAEGAEVLHLQSRSNRWGSHRLLIARWNNFLYFFDKHGAGRSAINRFWRRWWMIGESLHWLKAGIGFPVLGIRTTEARAIESQVKRPVRA
jgi:GT2 family glycosyltransferase